MSLTHDGSCRPYWGLLPFFLYSILLQTFGSYGAGFQTRNTYFSVTISLSIHLNFRRAESHKYLPTAVRRAAVNGSKRLRITADGEHRTNADVDSFS